MDAETVTMLRDSVNAMFERRGERLVEAIVEEGFQELAAEDEAATFATVFEAAGAKLVADPLLDLAVLSIRGELARLILSETGRAAGQADGEKATVNGLALGSPVGPCVLVAETPEGDRVIHVEGDALAWSPVGGLDPDLGLHRLSGVATASAARSGGDEAARLTALVHRCLAHQLVGLAEAVSGNLRDYASTRTQFGRPLTGWQTVQHRLAEVHVETMAARAALAAAWLDDRPHVSAVAKRQAGLAAHSACTHAQQIFGAIGFTAESGLHLYVRRCYALDALAGDGDALAAEIGAHLLAAPDEEPVHVRF